MTRLAKESRKQPELVPALRAAEQAQTILDSGRTIASAVAAGEIDPAPLAELHLLSAKPFIYVFNVDEGALGDRTLRDELAALVAPAEAVVVCAQIEAEVAALDPDDAAELLAGYGQEESGLVQLVHVGFRTLGLQTFLTAGEKESRAWTIHIGDTAPQAAGTIHTDFERGFIKAEIVSYDDLVEAGSLAAVARRRQGPGGGQGVRDAGRGRGRVPLQRVLSGSLRRPWRSRHHSEPQDRHLWETPGSLMPEPRTTSVGVSVDPQSGHRCVASLTSRPPTLDRRRSLGMGQLPLAGGGIPTSGSRAPAWRTLAGASIRQPRVLLPNSRPGTYCRLK